MDVGVVLPQGELHGDAGALREFAQAAQELGFGHLLAYDHVLGADPDGHPDWKGPYAVDNPFHEPLVLFGFLAGVCDLDLVTSVLVLPQRQTALVAKQAAEVSLLSGGRLRLGVGIGWNAVEYDALGLPMKGLGARLDEQIGLLRRFWTERSFSFTGAFEHVDAAGINPLPTVSPPVWVGAGCPAAYRRAGRLADGWMPRLQPGPELDEARAVVEAAAIKAGRSPGAVGLHGRTKVRDGETAARAIDLWREAGAAHLSVSTLGAGRTSLDDHLRALTEIAEALR